jgi:hypothetical protein
MFSFIAGSRNLVMVRAKKCGLFIKRSFTRACRSMQLGGPLAQILPTHCGANDSGPIIDFAS